MFHSENKLANDIRPNKLQLNLENLPNNITDLISPEQQKTISEEINTTDLLSSDFSATIDATNTLDDLKTCISMHLNDDANNTKLENSENNSQDANSPTANEPVQNLGHTTYPHQSNDFSQKSSNVTCQHIVEPHLNYKSNENGTDETISYLLTPESETEDTHLKQDNSKITHLDQQGLEVAQLPEQNESEFSNKSPELLSGEEDPWVMNYLK